jgi:signal transduction histidine kinase
MTNAIKFSFPGGNIDITAKRNEGMVRLSIRDYGMGMEASLVEKVFSPGKQTTRVGTEGESGTGFGMPLVKKFITAYEGNIEVFSRDINDDNENHGTEIVLMLLGS